MEGSQCHRCSRMKGVRILEGPLRYGRRRSVGLRILAMNICDAAVSSGSSGSMNSELCMARGSAVLGAGSVEVVDEEGVDVVI